MTTASKLRLASESPTRLAPGEDGDSRRLRPVLRRPRAKRVATALEAVNPNSAAPPSLIDPKYKTPYAIHITGGVQHAFNERWTASADYIHEQGNHGYRAFPYPAAPFSHPTTAPVSRADAAPAGQHAPLQSGRQLHALQAQTWGCVLGELFDYVDGVCTRRADRTKGSSMLSDPATTALRRRCSPSLVLAGTVHIPAVLN